VFGRFTARLVEAVPPRYAAGVALVPARFTDILLLDGSRLAAIAHRLKLLWRERAVVLPGCLLGVYNLGRGLCRQLHFSADVAAGEMTRAKGVLRAVAHDTLLIGDPLYCTADCFDALPTQGCWGLFRRTRQLSLHKLQRLSKHRHGGGCLEDWLVRAGSGVSSPPQLVGYIRWRQGGTRYELLTNVLAPARLAAAEAWALYPYRWRIERMDFDLKEVLTLSRIYAGNPNAVAMQVYAAGIVYNALRVAQGDVAEAAGLEPEAISPAKFSPKMAAACQSYVVTQQWERQVRHLNPHRRLRMIDWRTERWASVAVPVLHIECRSGAHRRRRYCPARRHWKSLAHVRGGRKLTKLS